MSSLNVLSDEDFGIVQKYFQTIKFPKDTRIIQEGTPGDGGYLIEEGEVRIEIQHAETDSDGVIGYSKAGDFLGELSLLDGRPRSASAFAQTDVVTQWFSKENFEALCEKYPTIGLAISKALAKSTSEKLRKLTDQVASYIFADEVDAETNAMIARSVAAQKEFKNWTEEQIDTLLKDIAETIASHAEELAEATVKETQMGNIQDKTIKIRFGSLDVYQTLSGKPAAGLLGVDSEKQISDIATPVGVILGLIPVTNPISTLVFKTLIALKGRNAIVFSCHRNALGVGNRAGEIIQEVIRKHNTPADLVQWIRERTSRRKTAMFMKHPDVTFILATGGPSMVKAAYSSGTPAIGVGSGNAPAWICSDADLDAASQNIVRSKSFDNGVICGSENNLIVDTTVRQDFIKALESAGAAVLSADEKNRLKASIFDEHSHLQRDLVGKSAESIAKPLGIKRDYPIRLIVVPGNDDEIDGPLGREKLAPILSVFTTNGVEEGLELCQHLLSNQGQGHTATIHTQSPELVDRFGLEIPASRILVNLPAAQGCIGIGNGLTASLTLGCGTLGGNSTTDNVTYTHLLNIKRLARSV